MSCGKESFLRSQAFSLSPEKISFKKSVLTHHRCGHKIDSELNFDIIDKDVERRGKPAFHVKAGVGKAILTGHKMLITGLDTALKHGKEFSRLYLDSWSEVVNGEINEVDFNKNRNKIKKCLNKITDF